MYPPKSHSHLQNAHNIMVCALYVDADVRSYNWIWCWHKTHMLSAQQCARCLWICVVCVCLCIWGAYRWVAYIMCLHYHYTATGALEKQWIICASSDAPSATEFTVVIRRRYSRAHQLIREHIHLFTGNQHTSNIRPYCRYVCISIVIAKDCNTNSLFLYPCSATVHVCHSTVVQQGKQHILL